MSPVRRRSSEKASFERSAGGTVDDGGAGSCTSSLWQTVYTWSGAKGPETADAVVEWFLTSKGERVEGREDVAALRREMKG